MKLYRILGIEPSASAADIKTAYRAKANRAHPDKEGGRHEDFIEIQRAYDVLSNPARRKVYDETDAVDDVMQREAEQTIVAQFMNLMHEGRDGEDFIALMKAQMREAKQSNVNEIQRLRYVIHRRKRVMSRISRRGEGKNILTEALAQNIESAGDAVLLLMRDAQVADVVLATLEQYEYNGAPLALSVVS